MPKAVKKIDAPQIARADSGVIKVVRFDDIDWVDAAGDYMCIHAQGETW